MIKINLLGDQESAETSNFLFVSGYLGSLAIVFVIFFFMYLSASTTVGELSTEKAKLEGELATLQATTKDVKDLEKMRLDLNNKLVVIARLKKSKVGPVRVLDDLNIAIPDRAWVTEIKEAAGTMKIIGQALDNQTIANFMQRLDASDYFDTVDLVETKQAEDRGVNIYSFTLQTKINYAGKLQLQKSEPAAGEKTKSAANSDSEVARG